MVYLYLQFLTFTNSHHQPTIQTAESLRQIFALNGLTVQTRMCTVISHMFIQFVYRRLALANKQFDAKIEILTSVSCHYVTSLPLCATARFTFANVKASLSNQSRYRRQVCTNGGCKLPDFRLFIAAHCIRSLRMLLKRTLY